MLAMSLDSFFLFKKDTLKYNARPDPTEAAAATTTTTTTTTNLFVLLSFPGGLRYIHVKKDLWAWVLFSNSGYSSYY